MRLRHTGHAPVHVVGRRVAPGETLTIEDDAVAASLLAQGWADASGDQFDAMDREALLAFAAQHEIDVNTRLGERRLREQVRVVGESHFFTATALATKED